MALLDRPDSTLLLVIMGGCILGLLVLAAMTFFPGLSGRFRSGGPTDAYPTEPVDFAGRLARAGYDEPLTEPALDREAVTVVAAPKPAAKRAPARKTTSTAKKTTAKKTAAKKTTSTRTRRTAS